MCSSLNPRELKPYIPGLADQVSHTSVTEPVKPDPVDFFPSPSENLISPVSGEISNFARQFVALT